jgi:hypothetical protein
MCLSFITVEKGEVGKKNLNHNSLWGRTVLGRDHMKLRTWKVILVNLSTPMQFLESLLRV